jgi:hypothetical protein
MNARKFYAIGYGEILENMVAVVEVISVRECVA